ncbi:hypothetical protein Tco_1005174 [Tanacetum coccineum]|uniref:FHA domain-containing protein n=1 Tax=Tanacetum coccineum TaxID=301880 RepID=A0ABQ5FE05_9ASTR
MTFIHTSWKRVRAPQAHIDSLPVLPSLLVVPSSPLSHPRDFVPEEIMPPQKRANFLSPPSSPTDLSIQPQIDTILNHLDEFPLEHIELIEYGREDYYGTLTTRFSRTFVSRYHAIINAQYIEHIIPPTPPKDTDPPVGSPIPSSPYSLVGFSSPVRSTTPQPDYPFDESIFAELDNSLWIIPRPREVDRMAAQRKSTSQQPAIDSHAAIRN